jgi:homogentisate 1,2-dioxygenase
MPFYQQRGDIPPKRHTVYRQPDGSLYTEHLMGSLGFDGPASLLYHHHAPTAIKKTKLLEQQHIKTEADPSLRMRHFRTAQVPSATSATLDRTTMLFNRDVTISMVQPNVTDDFFFRNGLADQIHYVSHGEGFLESEFGEIPYRAGDYVVVPRGILHRFRLGEGNTRMLVIETPSHVRFPTRYMTKEGQLMEHAPFCERDIRPPGDPSCRDERGEFRVIVKQNDILSEIILDHHPFDVVGWDGCYYPWALSIHDLAPIVGMLHQPPPVHQTFQADQFVVCSFTPRVIDFHPEAVPAPYNHSNVMSDEVLYYANDEFLSRSGIERGSLTLHPAGLPHGPQPGRTEDSIGASRIEELAVMVDTFYPLQVAETALAYEDEFYGRSWLET